VYKLAHVFVSGPEMYETCMYDIHRVAEHPKENIVKATLPADLSIPPIAVLMMACDRVTVSRSIDQLLKYY